MNESRAREILGVSAEATPDEVDGAFRKLASISHPDKGGSADKMTEVLAARESLLGTKSARSSDLITIDAVRDLVRVVTNQNETSTRRQELSVLRADFQQRSTNRLKDRRRLVAIVAAVAAAVTFFGKDLPIDDLVEVVAIPHKQEIERAKKERDEIVFPALLPAPAPLLNGQKSQPTVEEKVYQTALADATKRKVVLSSRIEDLESSQAKTTRMKSMVRVMAALLAMTLGMFAWMLSQEISRTESNLEEFDERTETRAGFSHFLRELFDGKVPSEWAEGELCLRLRTANASWLRQLSSQLGAPSFARYTIRRGKALGFLVSRDVMVEDLISERYTLRPVIEANASSTAS